jgi:hypothetical protein
MDMNIQTEFVNAGYYIAELELPTHLVSLGTWGKDWYPDIDRWCEETFGVSDIWGENPVNGWKRMRNKYFFTDEAKLNWFVTRWA